MELRRAAERPEHLRQSVADWLEYLAEKGDLTGLDKATRLLNDLRREGAITRADQYDLLEIAEQFAADVPGLSDVLAIEYQTIVLDELTLSLRQGRPMPVYVGDVRRGLHFLSRGLADELAQAIEAERQALAERSMTVPEQVVETAATINLDGVRLALVGGHDATRREVERDLRERYGLRSYVEIAPSSEEQIDRGRVLSRISGSDLIAVITGYIGHDLTNIVRDLKQAGTLEGEVIWLSCRGKSGVIREIVSNIRPQQ